MISVFQQNDPGHYELVANVPSAVSIRTGYYFAKCDRFYVVVPVVLYLGRVGPSVSFRRNHYRN